MREGEKERGVEELRDVAMGKKCVRGDDKGNWERVLGRMKRGVRKDERGVRKGERGC